MAFDDHEIGLPRDSFSFETAVDPDVQTVDNTVGPLDLNSMLASYNTNAQPGQPLHSRVGGTDVTAKQDPIVTHPDLADSAATVGYGLKDPTAGGVVGEFFGAVTAEIEEFGREVAGIGAQLPEPEVAQPIVHEPDAPQMDWTLRADAGIAGGPSNGMA